MSKWVKLRHAVFTNAFDKYKKNVMHPRHLGENNEAKSPVKYLSKNEKLQHQLIIKNGKFHSPDGKPITTSNPNLVGNYATQALYAVDLDGKFYAMMKSTTDRVQHSSLLSGEPTLCAGYIAIKNGVLHAISNASGHYKPSLGALLKTIFLLKKSGVDLNSFEVHYEAPNSIRPIKYKNAFEFIKAAPYLSTKPNSLFVRSQGTCDEKVVSSPQPVSPLLKPQSKK